MAKHKAATQVTLRTEEPPLLEQWVKSHWPKAAIVGVVVVGWVVFQHFQSKKAEESVGQNWDLLPNTPDAGLAEYQEARKALLGTPIEGWAYLQEAGIALGEDNLDAATSALGGLTQLPDHVLNKIPFPVGEDGAEVALGSLLSQRVQAQQEWEAANSSLFSNPDPAEGSPVVVIKTDAGDIEVTLYQEQAPDHVANFLAKAEEDYYDGILFHRVMNTPSMKIIQAGDPNSRDEEKLPEWGQGGPETGIKPEKNGLVHDSGYLSAAMPSGAAAESSGSQFFLTFSRCHHLDGRHTVFGKVTGGMDVVRSIGDLPTRPRDPETGQSDIPEFPPVISSLEIESQ